MGKQIKYYNRLAKISGPNTIELYKGDGEKETTVTSKYILIATGGRP